MKELRKKSYLTIFAILSLILIGSLILINVQSYNREKQSIINNLNVFDEGFGDKGPDDRFGPRLFGDMGEEENGPIDDNMIGPGGLNPEQMMFMDHEVYTVLVTDGAITEIISHGKASDDFDIQSVAEMILNTSKAGTEKVGNLYTSHYSYNYRRDGSIVVINCDDVATRCRRLLLMSIAVLCIIEALIAYISKVLTEWITKPARDSFNKQKEFIADASHELKTPLAVIMASAEELSDPEIRNNKSGEKLMDNIRYEADRMNGLIVQLLNLSRLEEGIKDSYAEEDLSRLVERTALAFEAVAYEQGVGIDTDIQKKVSFVCNREEMEKMISTVLDNAIRHSYKDTSVQVELKETKGRITVRIVNKGDPIPEGENKLIFERFYRGDASRNRTDNHYGLGLAIAKSIAVNHNGDIKAGSYDGSTVFEITLKK